MTVQHLRCIGCCVCGPGLSTGRLLCPDRPRSQIALVPGSREIVCATLQCICRPARQVRLCFTGNASPCFVAMHFRSTFYLLAYQFKTAALHWLTCLYRPSGPCRCGARVLSHKRCTQRGQRLQVKVAELPAWRTSKPLFIRIPTSILCHCLLCSACLC